jgi:hypothetical protein
MIVSPNRFTEDMRRWVLIILLLVYPFQVSLAMADKCCAMTSAGVTHHLAQSESGASTGEPVFVADDDSSALTDPHCAACTFGHILYLPSDFVVTPEARHHTTRIAFIPPRPTSPPAARLERPKWTAAAH